MAPADTIDEVIDRLGAILVDSRAAGSPQGYFPALYRKVTIAVRDRIAEGFFDDNPRLARLDVIFANRYLAAHEARQRGEPATGAWEYAFDVGDQYWPIVLQHLLLGINAHINLDLGIATAETAGDRADLESMRADFDRINQVAEIWMTLAIFNRYLGRVEDKIIHFSLGAARDHAWSVAQRLVVLDRAEWPAAIAAIDPGVVKLGRLVRHPGVVGSTVNKIIRLGERGSVARKIDILSD